MHEHRLGLIVGVVPHRDLEGAALTGDPGQEGVARAPRGFLKGRSVGASQSWHVHPLDRDRQSPLPGEGRHELGVGVGVGTTCSVMQVCNGKS